MTLVSCRYGDEGLGAECCLVGDGLVRCKVFDWEPCPYGKKVEGCGTCANCAGMSQDGDMRMVNCAANAFQMYSPYAVECKHWEKAVENRA
jgi:hypothetical protein